MEWRAEVVVEDLIPEGWYLADFHSAETGGSRAGPILTILFVIAEGPFAGTFASGIVAIRKALRRRAKLFQWAAALKGRELQAGDTLNEEFLQGCRAMIRIVPVDAGPEDSFNRVQQVRPSDFRPSKAQPGLSKGAKQRLSKGQSKAQQGSAKALGRG